MIRGIKSIVSTGAATGKALTPSPARVLVCGRRKRRFYGDGSFLPRRALRSQACVFTDRLCRSCLLQCTTTTAGLFHVHASALIHEDVDFLPE